MSQNSDLAQPNMTLFARYYDSNKLVETSMYEIERLIQDERQKEKIAELIFHRYYDRYLKIFYYPSGKQQTYLKANDGVERPEIRNDFNEEYKNGFTIMATCCLLIETIANFFHGQNQSNKPGSEIFKFVFSKAKEYGNPLGLFENEAFYKNIRCGLLHQGETYGQFKIRRSGQLFNSGSNTINSKLFCDALRDFLTSYRDDLCRSKWDSDIWDKCRIKLRHIIQNSK